MKTLIVDDEKLALSRLKRLLNDEKITDIVECNNPIEAIKEAAKNRFDIAFLDISMPQMDGLELANTLLQINPNIFIIFQTAYEEHALKAFSSGGIDYLLKPISKETVKKSLQKVFKYAKMENNKKIIAKRGNKIYLINIEDIYYIKADLDEVIIRIKEADAYLRKKIGDMEELLKDKNFFRIHRSYIINIDKIKSMQSVEQSKLEISFEGIDDVVTSSKDGAKEFRQSLEKRSL
ncbi:LytR/AlgR family response regulator transcription factor [Halarcobacter anaerophilus]|uniref:DNA-binding response regulator n=1 Tax=Halarcobacter anaerophilus TaxID=877500 RepID=A0A4Q0Y1T2_9BACT|nr:LytTR family DNA-binding domain-containing protein [Halarcobacter anaerophilus]QDF29664.1 two-component system response regulator, LytR/AlgR family [Halarcobacter anaerophilus]RXJ62589.1 DNA-binding response regulator [Halarcobacter anaerophilus]